MNSTKETKMNSTEETKMNSAKGTKDVRIVIAQAGWVFIGEYEFVEALNMVMLSNSSCIRIWGTTSGLGQLALHGKQKETVLDFMGETQIPTSSVIATIRCLPNKWAEI